MKVYIVLASWCDNEYLNLEMDALGVFSNIEDARKLLKNEYEGEVDAISSDIDEELDYDYNGTIESHPYIYMEHDENYDCFTIVNGSRTYYCAIAEREVDELTNK